MENDDDDKLIAQHRSRLRQGADVWNSWRKQNTAIAVNLRRAQLSGADLSGADLSGADLSGADLSGADLSGADLSGADLSEVTLRGANLSGAQLSEANLSGARLVSLDFRGAALIGADLSGAILPYSRFIGAFLIDADLSRADLKGANLSGADLSGANIDSSDFASANLTDTNVSGIGWDRRTMRGRYRGIRGIDSCYGNALFKRAAADQDYLDSLESLWKGTWRTCLFGAWGLIDYGRSLSRVVGIAFGLMALYGCIYSLWPELLSSKDAHSPFTPFYFSIVTYTTLGFGDIWPKTLLGEIIVSSEVLIGYTTLGLLLSVLAEKVARRS